MGRNFVETGQYLEQVFPLFGVRFIAINDNYDSLNSQSRDGMLVPIKSMINEMYSKDLSQKIQSCFRSKEARGESILLFRSVTREISRIIWFWMRKSAMW